MEKRQGVGGLSDPDAHLRSSDHKGTVGQRAFCPRSAVLGEMAGSLCHHLAESLTGDHSVKSVTSAPTALLSHWLRASQNVMWI